LRIFARASLNSASKEAFWSVSLFTSLPSLPEEEETGAGVDIGAACGAGAGSDCLRSNLGGAMGSVCNDCVSGVGSGAGVGTLAGLEEA